MHASMKGLAGVVTGALPLDEEITRFVWLTDTHAPDCIPTGPTMEFVRDFKPHYVILGGDNNTSNAFNHWAEDKSLRDRCEMPEVKQEYGDVRFLLYTPLRKAAPDAKIVQILGNHECWALNAADRDQKGRGVWEPWNYLEEVNLWVPRYESVALGKLWFNHGEHATGMYHARRMVEIYRRNMRYGHRHDLQEFSFTTAVDAAESYTARCGGTMEHASPGFMQKRPHNWQHAFGYGYVNSRTGAFQDATARLSPEGKFLSLGKLY